MPPAVMFHQKQKGIALLMLLVIIVLAFVSYYMSGLSMTEVKVNQEVKTLKVLNKAKEALIAFAVNYPEVNAANRGPGYLLCPDTNNDGLREDACNGPVTVGRFPWVSLNTGDLRDDSNERLWYAVSESFDFTNSPGPNKTINTETIGNITVRDRNNNIIYNGTTIDAAVAVIIAPGEALTRDDGVVQDRSVATGNPNAAVNYLDIDTTSGEDNATFQQGVLGGAGQDGFIEGEIVNAGGATIVNDRIMVITYSDIMQQVHKRVSREIDNAITASVAACGAYPVPSTFDPIKAVGGYTGVGLDASLSRSGHIPVDNDAGWAGCGNALPAWVEGEDWHKVTYYEFTAISPCAVCLRVNATVNVDALIIFAGRVLAAPEPENQVRGAGADMADYFEVENSNGDTTYDAAETEDYVHVIAP